MIETNSRGAGRQEISRCSGRVDHTLRALKLFGPVLTCEVERAGGLDDAGRVELVRDRIHGIVILGEVSVFFAVATATRRLKVIRWGSTGVGAGERVSRLRSGTHFGRRLLGIYARQWLG